MKLSKKHLYWLLQFIGWGIPFALNATAKLLIGGFSLSTSYILFENASLLVSGILFSHLFRYIYKYQICWDGWSWKRFFLTALAILGCSISMSILIELICAGAYSFFENEPLKRDLTDYLVTFINSMIYLLFWLTLYIAINYFLRNQQLRVERLQLENMAKESQLNTLRGQINPHFMFNSLNNIRGLMLEDVEKARDMLTQLSEMLRFSLARKNDNFVALHEEVAIVHNYIALAKIQLEDRLKYEERIDDHLRQIELPPMLIQMLIENAIKHGIATSKNGGKVQLDISRSSDYLEISVVNDGQLTTTTSETQIGVQNIQQRLLLLYDREATFSLTEKEHTVIAKVQIPIR